MVERGGWSWSEKLRHGGLNAESLSLQFWDLEIICAVLSFCQLLMWHEDEDQKVGFAI